MITKKLIFYYFRINNFYNNNKLYGILKRPSRKTYYIKGKLL